MRGLLLIFVLLASASCAAPTDADPDRATATVAFDAGPLLAPGERVASVLERMELRVQGPQGATATQNAPLSAAEPVATFEVVTVPGPHRFEARAFSNGGTALFEGARDVTVSGPGFVVEIDLHAVAGVLVVTPDSVAIPAGAQVAEFVVENRGVALLTWEVARVSPPGCDGGCVIPRPEAGEVGPGGASLLAVVPVGPVQGLHTLTLVSTVGTVELKVWVEP